MSTAPLDDFASTEREPLSVVPGSAAAVPGFGDASVVSLSEHAMKKSASETDFDVCAPRPHQVEAVGALYDWLRVAGRAQLIHACGAGKTRTSAMFASRIEAKTVLVMLPNLELVKQSMMAWAHQFNGDIDFRAVCSDKNVTPRDERLVGQGHVLNTPAEIGAFLASRSLARVKVLFSTYQSSAKVAEGTKQAKSLGWKHFDLAVCDEAHRLASKPRREFSLVLHDDAIACRRRLFMTATPRLTLPGTQNERFVAMDDETMFGPVIHRYSFAEATRDGVLSPYRVTILGIDPADLKDIKWAEKPSSAEVRHQMGLVATLRMMHDHEIQRMVTYHLTQDGAERFSSDLRTLNERNLWHAHVPDLSAVAIHGNIPAYRREMIMNLLKPSHPFPTVVSNPKVLTEGVDVPALDGVVFVDPRNSLVDTVQAVGRALRTAPGKKVGHIVIPVLMHPGETAEKATKRGGFQMAWQVLATLRDMDDCLAAWVDGQVKAEPSAEMFSDITFEVPSSFNAENAQRLALVAKLHMVNAVSQVPGPDVVDIRCDCCHQVLLDRIFLNGTSPLG